MAYGRCPCWSSRTPHYNDIKQRHKVACLKSGLARYPNLAEATVPSANHDFAAGERGAVAGGRGRLVQRRPCLFKSSYRMAEAPHAIVGGHLGGRPLDDGLLDRGRGGLRPVPMEEAVQLASPVGLVLRALPLRLACHPARQHLRFVPRDNTHPNKHEAEKQQQRRTVALMYHVPVFSGLGTQECGTLVPLHCVAVCCMFGRHSQKRLADLQRRRAKTQHPWVRLMAEQGSCFSARFPIQQCSS